MPQPHATALTCVYYDIIFNSRTRRQKRTDASDLFLHTKRERQTPLVRHGSWLALLSGSTAIRARRGDSRAGICWLVSACDTHTCPTAWMRRPLRIKEIFQEGPVSSPMLVSIGTAIAAIVGSFGGSWAQFQGGGSCFEGTARRGKAPSLQQYGATWSPAKSSCTAIF